MVQWPYSNQIGDSAAKTLLSQEIDFVETQQRAKNLHERYVKFYKGVLA